MSKNKTQATTLSVNAYLAAIPKASRREDCVRLCALFAKSTGAPAVMWGSAIVGFGVHRYPLAGGKEGEICAVGFSSRTDGISIYGVTGQPGAEELLARLGKHKQGKGCLSVAKLEDVDVKVIERLVRQAFKAKKSSPKSCSSAPEGGGRSLRSGSRVRNVVDRALN